MRCVTSHNWMFLSCVPLSLISAWCSLRNLVGPLRLNMSDISTDLNNLVRTFKSVQHTHTLSSLHVCLHTSAHTVSLESSWRGLKCDKHSSELMFDVFLASRLYWWGTRAPISSLKGAVWEPGAMTACVCLSAVFHTSGMSAGSRGILLLPHPNSQIVKHKVDNLTTASMQRIHLRSLQPVSSETLIPK